MNRDINLGKVDKNGFKESKSAGIAKIVIEHNNKIKTHFLEMDKTPNFDGKLMILEGSFERITVEVQIKTIPEKIKRNTKGEFSFMCDTKAMNSVMEKVTFNPIVLIAVDIENFVVYYKLLTREFVSDLEIGKKKTKTICFSEEDKFAEEIFIKEICREVKITNTDTNCITECGIIRDSIKNADKITEENFQLVFNRGKVKGYFTTYRYMYGENREESLIISKIKMEYDEKAEELLHFQYDKDYIHINRKPSDVLDITDADIANIILEVAKEVKKPILYTNKGKPTLWFDKCFLWQLRAEEIYLDWYYR
jgi:hypothetical protein